MTGPAQGAPSVRTWAHDMAPEPMDDATDRDRTRYHLARAIGLFLGWMGHSSDALAAEVDEHRQHRYLARLHLVVAESQVALLTFAVHTSQPDPIRWASDRAHAESSEWLWQCGEEVGLDVDSQNPTEALGVYEAVGFEVRRRWTTYRRP